MRGWGAPEEQKIKTIRYILKYLPKPKPQNTYIPYTQVQIHLAESLCPQTLKKYIYPHLTRTLTQQCAAHILIRPLPTLAEHLP